MRRKFKNKRMEEQYTETDFLKDLAQEVLKGTTTTVDVEDILYGRYSSDAEAEKAIKKFYRVLHNIESVEENVKQPKQNRTRQLKERQTVDEYLKDMANLVIQGTTSITDVEDEIYSSCSDHPEKARPLIQKFHKILRDMKEGVSTNVRHRRLQEKEDVDIDVKNPGVLEVPEGKSVDSLPVSHFVNLAKKKGTSDVTKALNNLQVWNKKKDPKLSKWAGDMIDKVKQQTEKNECIRPNRTRRSKLKEGKEQTVGQYITQQLDDGKIQEKQVIAFYDKNNNVKWLGKAGYYPIYLDREPFKSAKKVKNEIRINERGVSESTNMKESPMDYLDSEKRAIIDKLESLGYSGTKPINFGGSVLIMYSKTYWTDKRTSSGLEIYIDPLEGDVTVQEFEHEVDTEDLTDLCPVKYVTSANDVLKIDRWARQAKKHEYSLNYESIRYDRYDPNVEAQFMNPGNLYDDMPETEYGTDDTFEFYVSYCMNNCGNEEIAREYLESENLPESFIDSIIDEVYLRFDMQ